MNGNGDPWPADLVEELRRLHAEGLAFSEIAAKLGVSRNAAIGRAKRLGLVRGHRVAAPRPPKKEPPRTTPRRSEAPLPAKKPKPAPVSKVEAEAVASVRAMARDQGMGFAVAASQPVALQGLNDRRCRWPLGPTMAHAATFCGADIGFGRTYCPDHRRLAYVPAPAPKPSRRDA